MPQQFPPDEFDEITDSERRGTHREKSAKLGGVSSIVFVAIVAVVVVLLAVAVVNVVNSGKSGSNQETSISGPDAKGSGSSGSHKKSGKKSGTTEKATTSPTAKKTATKSPTASVDKSQKIQVLNSTTTSGMAGRVSTKLGGDGWSVSSTGNIRSSLSTTTVYYESKDLKATAEAVAKTLGTTAVKQSTQYSTTITVVLASDYSDS